MRRTLETVRFAAWLSRSCRLASDENQKTLVFDDLTIVNNLSVSSVSREKPWGKSKAFKETWRMRTGGWKPLFGNCRFVNGAPGISAQGNHIAIFD